MHYFSQFHGVLWVIQRNQALFAHGRTSPRYLLESSRRPSNRMKLHHELWALLAMALPRLARPWLSAGSSVRVAVRPGVRVLQDVRLDGDRGGRGVIGVVDVCRVVSRPVADNSSPTSSRTLVLDMKILPSLLLLRCRDISRRSSWAAAARGPPSGVCHGAAGARRNHVPLRQLLWNQQVKECGRRGTRKWRELPVATPAAKRPAW